MKSAASSRARASPRTLTAFYLKIVKAGTTYTGYYSADNLAWTQIGQYAGVNFSSAKVGVTAYNGGAVEPDIPADFDWFCIR